jgi:DNA (cytosine-5)-methyltransferase 1
MEPAVLSPPVFYNDNCAYAVDWLRNLISAGHLPAGVVDGRDIERVTSHAVEGFKECHFFAGIGTWSLALRLAGWPPGRPVWTGSCPCQPFSTAGSRKGTVDSRHLWPAFLRLIEECRPPTIFGEQVASKLGRKWLARVRFDLEALGYGVGAADLCGACVGAPHIRQRLYWVADTEGDRQDEQRREARSENEARRESHSGKSLNGSGPGGLDHAASQRTRLAGAAEPKGDGAHDGVPGPSGSGLRGPGRLGQPHGTREAPLPGVPAGPGVERAGGLGFWDAYDLVYCRDNKFRRVEPGVQCLVDGTSFRLADGRSRQDVSRSNLLRGIGNAIIPQVAAMFVRAYLGR